MRETRPSHDAEDKWSLVRPSTPEERAAAAKAEEALGTDAPSTRQLVERSKLRAEQDNAQTRQVEARASADRRYGAMSDKDYAQDVSMVIEEVSRRAFRQLLETLPELNHEHLEKRMVRGYLLNAIDVGKEIIRRKPALHGRWADLPEFDQLKEAIERALYALPDDGIGAMVGQGPMAKGKRTDASRVIPIDKRGMVMRMLQDMRDQARQDDEQSGVKKRPAPKKPGTETRAA